MSKCKIKIYLPFVTVSDSLDEEVFPLLADVLIVSLEFVAFNS